MSKYKCQRCGKCCKENGSFWYLSEHPFVMALSRHSNITKSDNQPCGMLAKENGKWVCLIEKYLHRDWKPQVCKDYPFGKPCFNERKAKK